MSKFKSDKMIDGRPERERVEEFCGRFVESGNKMHAYRLAFSPDPAKATQWIWDQVRTLMGDPEVQQRVQAMRDEANASQIVTVQGLLQDWADIAAADPNELISIEVDCCRYCTGIGHAYHWVNEEEFMRATESAIEAHEKAQRKNGEHIELKLPTDEGGYGYHPRKAPVYDCPQCFGRGHVTPMARDTRHLSPQARKLYAGAKIGKDGQIEIKMHDQMKAREQLARIMGYFKDGVIPVVSVQPGTSAGDVDRTQEDPQQAYLKLIDTSR